MAERLPDGTSELASPWEIPGSKKMPAYGAAAAVSAVGTIAAPLLAGFSFALVGQLVGGIGSGVHWRDGTILLLILAGLLFIGSLQSTLHARQWEATPKDILDWWPNSETNEDEQKELYQQQQALQLKHELWVTLGIVGFHLGIICFFFAIATLLFPPSGSAVTVPRVLSILLIGGAIVVEFAWALVREFIKDEATGSIRRTWGNRRARRRLGVHLLP